MECRAHLITSCGDGVRDAWLLILSTFRSYNAQDGPATTLLQHVGPPLRHPERLQPVTARRRETRREIPRWMRRLAPLVLTPHYSLIRCLVFREHYNPAIS